VNLHGALISAPLTFHLGLEVEIYVILTDKHAIATVVYIDPDEPHNYGIALKEPQKIFGESLFHPTIGKIPKVEQTLKLQLR
jgi:hypothetical protein